MNNFTLNEIPEGSFFTAPVYLDENFILTAPEIPVSAELLNTLKNWNFDSVSSEGTPQEEYSSDGELIPGLEGAPDQGLLISDSEELVTAVKFYNGFVKYVENLFHLVDTNRGITFSSIAQRIKELCDMVKDNRRYLLRVMKNNFAEGEDYMTSHAAKSAIISVIIGSFIKLPPHRLIELGVAALLHEIGMNKIPPQIYMNKRELNPQEKKLILSHPVMGYNLLKSLDFPLVVSVAALEHHERENGTGYPQKLTGAKISLYAKIIAVACSYEALTSSRPHKDAKDGYNGMLDLLKNEGKQYDDTIVKALVFSLSIYPIGLYVLLSNGKKGQVVDVNPENPKYPKVQVFGELSPDGKNRVIDTSPGGVSIDRPLRKDEII